MGSSSSKNNHSNNGNEWEIARQRAIKIYNYRIKNYNYIEHGPREYYMLQVEAEYELESIPECFRSGNSGEWK